MPLKGLILSAAKDLLYFAALIKSRFFFAFAPQDEPVWDVLCSAEMRWGKRER